MRRIWLPAYVYAYNPWYGYHPYPTWQEYDLAYYYKQEITPSSRLMMQYTMMSKSRGNGSRRP